jgi:hypothetical protein
MKNEDQTGQPKEASVVDMASFRKKKSLDQEFARDRKPLYVSHLTGKVSGSPNGKKTETGDFADRLQRIRSSLEKINRLMGDLKRMASSSETDSSTKLK